MTNAAKFILRIPAAKPGDFVPSGFAVYDEKAESVIVKDGDVIEAVGEPYTDVEDRGTEDECVITYRRVRTSDGFEGNVVWCVYDGTHSGFEVV